MNPIKSIFSDLSVLFRKDSITYSNDKIDEIKSNICDGALISIAVVSIPTLIGSLSRAFEIGIKPAMLIQVFLAMSIWVSCFVRKRLPYWFRATHLIFVFYFVALTGLLQFGLLAAAGAWFIIVPALSVVLFNIRIGLAMLMVTFISVVVIATLSVKGFIIFDYNGSEYAASLPVWINFSLTYLLGAVFIFVAVSILVKSFIESLTTADSIAK